MTRDYAKKTTSKKTSKKKKSSYWTLWIFTLLIFATFTLGLVYVGKYQRHLRHLMKAAPKAISTEVAKPTANNEPAVKVITPPKFDFYTILPQKKANGVIAGYELEITTFKDFATADHLKAELTLLGFAVSIVPVRNAGIQKYRVLVGPYDIKEGALSDQVKLKQDGIRSILKKIK